MRIALFASGTGSNVEAILQAVQETKLEADPVFVFSDRSDARVLEKAKNYEVQTYSFRPRDFDNKQRYEEALLKLLEKNQVDWVILAGYMRLLGPTLLEPYENRIVNIHPSILPAFPGIDAIGQALEAEADQTGVTVHYVDAGMDTGQVIRQETVAIDAWETKESLAKKVQKIEHRMYPETLQCMFKKAKKR
ncbi:phosphoribosylglycinamide formyltransferase-1 [Geomicrobium halophilum]|uniref:Phosphoribosylglycinamide formyltransferase n=1 Tax=Geomicrobium halophilum TaxID=549000 RepID=A0A841Q030_9BACL|nr:phosphoribosylglycinamide formyltransferase [Geomicrobium halophilum]MBB6450833.1 phosphoribosylglycinamide formyltransferase-1 [Geomicrobium halophilum]